MWTVGWKPGSSIQTGRILLVFVFMTVTKGLSSAFHAVRVCHHGLCCEKWKIRIIKIFRIKNILMIRVKKISSIKNINHFLKTLFYNSRAKGAELNSV